MENMRLEVSRGFNSRARGARDVAVMYDGSFYAVSIHARGGRATGRLNPFLVYSRVSIHARGGRAT